VWQLDKRVVYGVEDGVTFQLDEDGETFREVYRDSESGAWIPRSDPAEGFGHPGLFDKRDEAEIANDARAVRHETGARFLMEVEKIHTLSVEMKTVRQRLAKLQSGEPPYEEWRIDILNDRLGEGMSRLRKMYGDLAGKARPEVASIEEMAGRMDNPAWLEHAGSKFVQGATVAGGKAIKGLATTNGSDLFDKLRILEKLERDGDFRNIGGNRSEYMMDMPLYQWFLKAAPEERVRMKQEIVDDINAVQTGFLYTTGEDLQQFGEKGLNLNPRFEEEFFASKLPEGLGKTAAYLAATATGAFVARRGGKGGAGSGRTAAGTLVASQELAGQMFDDALENGATLEQAFRARDLGQMLGMIEAIPIMPILNKLTPEIRSATLRTFSELIKSGAETGIKEAATIFGDNLVAQGVVQYDPERKLYEGVVDGFKVSFTSDILKNSLLKAIGINAGT
ncbi:MAG: hypothetical protein OEY16_11390, partial [Alphaproteobacteria bacterium]|nr:hypothetical protein [Alphaproteobacteria bacterium]